ncbi:MAG: hypothetical protein RLZ55_551, partial [Actinomycetota bacterium]
MASTVGDVRGRGRAFLLACAVLAVVCLLLALLFRRRPTEGGPAQPPPPGVVLPGPDGRQERPRAAPPATTEAPAVPRPSAEAPPAPPGGPAETPESNDVTLVVTRAGAPLLRCAVRSASPPVQQLSTTRVAAGTFAVDVPPGAAFPMELEVSELAGQPGVRVACPSVGCQVDVVLPNVGAVSAVVQTDAGSPAAGAVVTIAGRQSVADESGRALLQGVDAGVHRSVWVQYAGEFHPRACELEVHADSVASLDLRVPAARRATVRVLSAETGLPIVGARVRVTDLSAYPYTTLLDHRTDQAGECSLTRTAPAASWVAVESDDTEPVFASGSSADPEGVIVVRATRRTPRPVRGRVVDADGRPVGGVRVSHTSARQTVTDSNGAFHLRDVPRQASADQVLEPACETSTLFVMKSGWASPDQVSVPEEGDVEITLARLCTVTGLIEVLPDAARPQQVRVSVTCRDGTRYSGEARVEPAARGYRWTWPKAPRVVGVFRLEWPGGTFGAETAYDARGNEPWSADFVQPRGGSVSVVVDARDGQVPDGVWMKFSVADSGHLAGDTYAFVDRATASYRTSTPVPPGRYRLLVGAPGMLPRDLGVIDVRPDAVTECACTLRFAVSVTLVVLCGQQVVPGATVSVATEGLTAVEEGFRLRRFGMTQPSSASRSEAAGLWA